ncbi:MAG TPA: hypothetical protein VF607_02560, partial [Verrucomicrobiae bacterium]
MIALHSDQLLFQLSNGESIPCSAEMITVEIAGNSEGYLDPELLRNAATSVFHYFKVELQRVSVTVGEFAQALEKALHALGLTLYADQSAESETREANLDVLAGETGDDLELLFYPRLRDELRAQLRYGPRVVRFRGLRGCAKRLAGAQRWGPRCEKMQEQIVGYLRECLVAEPEQKSCALLVD